MKHEWIPTETGWSVPCLHRIGGGEALVCVSAHGFGSSKSSPTNQLLLQGQPVGRQSPDIALIPQLADGAVLRAGDQRRNAPVAAAVQLRHRPAGLLLVSDGHRGVGVRRQGAVLVVIRAADIGDVQRRQLLGGIVGPAAQ